MCLLLSVSGAQINITGNQIHESVCVQSVFVEEYV